MSDFTNRHGHSFSEVKIAADTLPEPAHKTESLMPAHRKRRTFRLKAIHFRILAVILVLGVLTPVFVGEYVRYVYEVQVTNAKNDVQSIFSDVKKIQKSNLSSEALKPFDARLLTVRDKLCSGGFWDNLAKLYPRALAAYDACGAYRARVAGLEAGVNEAAAQLAYLTELQTLLGGVTKPVDEQFAVLSSQQELWQALVDNMKQLSVPTSFNQAHAGLLTQSVAIRDQWIALVDASNSYDSVKFSDARTKLDATYGAFQFQTNVFNSAVSNAQQQIADAVSSL